MPLIAMNREIGSLGRDVAQGIADALGIKVEHHEIVDALANRARVRKSHVLSFLDGKQGLFERLTTDQLSLGLLTADEIMSLAESEKGVVLRGWGATSLLKEVPHAVRVCISASRELRVQRTMSRLGSTDKREVERVVDQNDESAGVVMRRHFHIDSREIDEYDMCLNTDRMPVAQCVELVLAMVKSPQFAENEASRRKLRDVALVHRVKAALRVNSDTAHVKVRVAAENGKVIIDGLVDTQDQSEACTRLASNLKGVGGVENRLRATDSHSRVRS